MIIHTSSLLYDDEPSACFGFPTAGERENERGDPIISPSSIPPTVQLLNVARVGLYPHTANETVVENTSI